MTCDLPLQPVPLDSSWKHLEDIHLADPDFGRLGRIDVLLGVDIFVETLLQGRRDWTSWLSMCISLVGFSQAVWTRHPQVLMSVVQHFKENHLRTKTRRFIVPLPKKPNTKALGESLSQAIRRFLVLERSLRSKDQFGSFNDMMEEYFQMGHAELVPMTDLEKSQQEVFYLPIHAVRKETSSTTKIRAVFDASAKSSTGRFVK